MNAGVVALSLLALGACTSSGTNTPECVNRTDCPLDHPDNPHHCIYGGCRTACWEKNSKPGPDSGRRWGGLVGDTCETKEGLEGVCKTNPERPKTNYCLVNGTSPPQPPDGGS